MKTSVIVFLMCIGTWFCQGQNLKLTIKQGSDAPNYETEHFYLLELSNTGSVTTNATISINNKECVNIKKIDQTDFASVSLEKNKQSKAQQITVQPGKSVEFLVKLSRPNNAKLNTWNCTEIVAMSKDGIALSNAVTIESLIPNPNNNN